MENGRSYFFRDLIVKILLVLLFVFLLMWLFPMPDLNPLYDKIFSQNIGSMTDAAKSYFTVSRLPQKEGESKKLTLGDMVDNKMIVEFTDSEGKTCDQDASYVEVTKKGDEYIYKTNLVCSNQSDYVVEYFGCYDVCKDDKCEVEVVEKPATDTKKVTEYQFYKEVSSNYIDKYICKKGYTLEGTKCVLNSEIEKQEDASMKCPNGYSYNSKTNKCELIKVENINASLSCPEGYVYSSSTNNCIKGTVNLVDANESYTCEKGTLVGTKCVITNVNKVEAQKVYSCKSGYTLEGTKCVLNGTKEVAAEKVYTCSKGTLQGTKCVITNTSSVEAQKVYSCSQGRLDGSKCIISTTDEINANLSYTCSKGTLSGSTCVIYHEETCGYSNWVCSNVTYTSSVSTSSSSTFTRKFLYQVGTNKVYEECSRVYRCSGGGSSTVAATAKYTCSEGTLSGTKCIVNSTKTVNANVAYKCKEGILNGSSCTLSNINEVNANVTYKCKEGTLKGDKCVISTTSNTDATVSYKCSVGVLKGKECEITANSEVAAKKNYNCQVGTLKGTKCEITGINTAETVYKCEYGTLDGKKCLITSTDIKEPIYYCKEGYTLANNKCYIVESSKDVQDATPVYKTKTEKVYKWSRSETLEGWIRTGKTRTSDLSITSRY